MQTPIGRRDKAKISVGRTKFGEKMSYILHISPNSKNINHMVIIYPGIDDITGAGPEPKTSNNLGKYDIFASFIARMSEPGVAVIVLEYSGPYAWGEPLNFSKLTDEIEKTLLAAMNALRKEQLDLDIEKIDLGAHSYGFNALYWSLANEIFSRVIGDYKCQTNVHLFEPYGLAAIKSAQENSLALRELEIIAAAQQRYLGMRNASPVQVAQNELQQLRAFDSNFQISNHNIMLGSSMPDQAIHDSYGAIDAQKTAVNLTKLSNVRHGGALFDALIAKRDQQLLAEPVLKGFHTLMHAWICALNGVQLDDVSEKAVNTKLAIWQKIEELLIKERLMAPKEAVEQKKGLGISPGPLKM